MYTIRTAEPEDAEALADLAARSFHAAYTDFNTAADMQLYIEQHFRMEALSAELRDRKNLFFLCCNGPDILGYLLLRITPIPTTEHLLPEIARFYVDPERKGSGNGRLLLEAAEQYAVSKDFEWIWLCVWQKNEAAISIYEHWGFRVCGETIFVLGTDPQNDFVMRKSLLYRDQNQPHN